MIDIYPGAIERIITDGNWVFTDALVGIDHNDLNIVIHKTACGGKCTALDVAQGFHDSKDHKSTHFIVARTGEVVQVVKLKDGAGGNGIVDPLHNSYWDPLIAKYGNLNRCTISIEHEDWSDDNSDTMPQAQVDASHKLCLWLVKEFKIVVDPIPHVHSHQSIQNTNRSRCPGPTYSFTNLFKFIKDNMTQTPQPVVNPGPPPVNFQTRSAETEWNSVKPGLAFDTGIAHAWLEDYCLGTFHGPPLTGEVDDVDWSGNPMKTQFFTAGACKWDGAAHWDLF